MYKIASSNLQGRADRSNIIDLALDDARSEIIPLPARVENLQRALRDIDAYVLTLPKGSPQRREIGLRKFQLQDEMKALRRKLPNPRDGLSDKALFNQIFKDEAFRILPRSHFDRVMSAAKRTYDEQKAQKGELSE